MLTNPVSSQTQVVGCDLIAFKDLPVAEVAKWLQGKLDFPYTFLDSLDKLDATIDSVPAQHWVSDLSGQKADVSKVLEFAKVFKLTTIRDLLEVYLAVDVKGLADVFTNYRLDVFADHAPYQEEES